MYLAGQYLQVSDHRCPGMGGELGIECSHGCGGVVLDRRLNQDAEEEGRACELALCCAKARGALWHAGHP